MFPKQTAFFTKENDNLNRQMSTCFRKVDETKFKVMESEAFMVKEIEKIMHKMNNTVDKDKFLKLETAMSERVHMKKFQVLEG